MHAGCMYGAGGCWIAPGKPLPAAYVCGTMLTVRFRPRLQPRMPPRASVWHETRSVRPKSPRQPAPQRSRLQVVRACVRAVRISAENREGGELRRWLPGWWGWWGWWGWQMYCGVTSSSRHRGDRSSGSGCSGRFECTWCDQSGRVRRKRRARGERGVGTGAPAPVRELCHALPPSLPLCLF